MPTPKQRKMTKINVAETSGVDHPAHLHEGWMIRKDADAATVQKLFGLPDNDKEGTNVPEIQKEETKPADAVVEADDVEKAGKNTPMSKDEIIAALKAEIAALKKGGKVDKSADSPAEELEALAKSADLPEAVRVVMEKQAEDIRKAEARMAKAEEDFAKERDARLDEQAITKSKDIFKAIAIEHDTVAPALRRVAVIDAELAKSVETALKAADEQLATAGLYAEIGKSAGTPAGAEAKLETLTKSIMEKEGITNYSVAMSKALSADPSLYEAIQAEKAGK